MRAQATMWAHRASNYAAQDQHMQHIAAQGEQWAYGGYGAYGEYGACGGYGAYGEYLACGEYGAIW